jgi:hypothetical protein
VDFDPAKFFDTRERIGTRYMDRALGVYVGIFGNVSQQSVYFTIQADGAGQLLDGGKAASDFSVSLLGEATTQRNRMRPMKVFEI